MAMTEAEIQHNIKLTCKDHGFAYYHTRNSFQSDAGFPDVVVAGPVDSPVAMAMFYETKTPRRKVEDKQVLWLTALRNSGNIARLVYESAAQCPGRYPEFEATLGDVYDDLAVALQRHLSRHTPPDSSPE